MRCVIALIRDARGMGSAASVLRITGIMVSCRPAILIKIPRRLTTDPLKTTFRMGKKIIIVLLSCFIVLGVSGCATIINGTSQKIQATSNPPGATVKVDGADSYVTPVKLRLERRRDHVLTFTKDGYENQTVRMMHVISEAVVGNTLLGGPLGWVFDIFAGTQYKLVPNPVHVELRKGGTNG